MHISPDALRFVVPQQGRAELLDYVMAFLPSPLDLPPVTGMNPKTEQEEVRHASESDPFCGLAFKIATDPVRRPSGFRARILG